ncbi:MAG: hypothetical protein COV70_01250 [Parcubacteria group bacterium CG11_big_fil_rev_8_21_14_0_20_39_22]|nr:MAG: hypothetical protein COV70_01250 [Parcubacteria group bacterium CG11_big_fil_rev_8_21_14_0_20_39_22]
MLKGSKAIIWDSEFTAWEGSMFRNWSGEGEHRELVQIGAILVDSETLDELDNFLIFIKPTINPVVSKYFTDLTGISQEQIDSQGVYFAKAMSLLKDFFNDFTCYSYGSDERVLEENCVMNEISFPFDQGKFEDVRKIFQTAGIDTVRYQSGTIVKAFGKEPRVRGHDALNDARIIADGLRFIKK